MRSCVGLGQAGGGGRLGLQPARLQGERELDRNVRSTRWSSADRWAPRRTSTALPSAVRSQRSPSNGSVGGSGPAEASTIHPSSRFDSSETASSENVRAQLVEQAGQRVRLAR